MKMKLFGRGAALAIAAACPVFATVCVAEEEENAAPAADAADPAAAPAPAVAPFYPLVKCVLAEGEVKVQLPNSDKLNAVEEGRYYPHGTRVVADMTAGAAPKAVFELSKDSKVNISAACDFKFDDCSDKGIRQITLTDGRININLPRTMPNGRFTVNAAFDTIAKNLAGESEFALVKKSDKDNKDAYELEVRCVTGSMSLAGAHWRAARMAAADNIVIKSGEGSCFTSLRGVMGSTKITLDKGIVKQRGLEADDEKDVPLTMDYSLFPKCVIKIWRTNKDCAKNVSVCTMTFDEKGALRDRYTFAENTPGLLFVDDFPKEEIEIAGKKSEETAAAITEAVETTEEGDEKKKDDEKKDEE